MFVTHTVTLCKQTPCAGLHAVAGDDTRSMPKVVNKMTKSTTEMSAAIDKQPIVPSLGHAPTNARENAESILWFVLVGGFFLTGVPGRLGP
jgi:hypothetical protein